MITHAEAEILATLVPVITLFAFFLVFAKIFLPSFIWYQKLIAKLEGRCYHEYDVISCDLSWVNCSVCRIELHEPNNYHPQINYKCTKCGSEYTALDWQQTKTLESEINVPDLERVVSFG